MGTAPEKGSTAWDIPSPGPSLPETSHSKTGTGNQEAFQAPPLAPWSPMLDLDVAGPTTPTHSRASAPCKGLSVLSTHGCNLPMSSVCLYLLGLPPLLWPLPAPGPCLPRPLPMEPLGDALLLAPLKMPGP